jgi:hypothetical protein
LAPLLIGGFSIGLLPGTSHGFDPCRKRHLKYFISIIIFDILLLIGLDASAKEDKGAKAGMRYYRLESDLKSSKKTPFFEYVSVLYLSVYILGLVFFLAFVDPFGYDSNIVRE